MILYLAQFILAAGAFVVFARTRSMSPIEKALALTFTGGMALRRVTAALGFWKGMPSGLVLTLDSLALPLGISIVVFWYSCMVKRRDRVPKQFGCGREYKEE